MGNNPKNHIDALSSITGKTIETGSPVVWLSKIRKEIDFLAGDPHQLQDRDFEELVRVNPAVKLLPFYEEILAAKDDEIEKTLRSSARHRAYPGIEKEWIWKWVRKWME